MKKAIKTTIAPAASGLLSQAIEVDGFVFTSGQIRLKLMESWLREQWKKKPNRL